GQLLSNPVGGNGIVGRLLKRLTAPARARDSGGPPGADAPTHRGSARPGAGRRTIVADAVGHGDGGSLAQQPGARYPEWDSERRTYRPDWCTVTESDPEPPVGASPPPLPDGAALRRPLARLGIELTRCRRQAQGEEIDLDAAVEARVDALAGVAPDVGVYVASLRRRRDLAALILLDVSGSAGEPGTAGRTVHEHQRAVAGALTVALHDLGDRVALYGFRSRGRQAVELQRVKAFDDHLDGSVAQRLAGLVPRAYTRLGAAIRHGTAILDQRSGTPRRLLVVVSDGFAYDHGYEASYGQADARRALLEARQQGIGCLCLSVGTDVEPAALRRVFGSAAHATVPRPAELPRHIGPLFRAALRSAEAQHRVFQRTERTRERHVVERRADGRSTATVLRPGR
ncbi:MAG: nitric oxide reductase activation protein NorD, partial [Acidimicrobiales bacterium]